MARAALALHHGLIRLYTACGVVGAVFLALIGVLVAASILARLADFYFPGLSRYTGYAMAAASFFALAHTFHTRGHIRVAMLLNALGPGRRKIAEIWCHLAAAAVAVFLAFYLTRMTWVSYRLGDVSDGADATALWIPQVAVAAGSIVLAVCVLHHLVLTVLRPASAFARPVGGPEV